ncbi:MAG: MoaD/ThiS family protein [Balneolales bacterium]
MLNQLNSTGNCITLNLRWFSILARLRGKAGEEFEMPEGCNGEVLIDRLCDELPEIHKYRSHIRLAVNREYVDPSVILHDGDEVALITPVSGG